MRKFNTTIKHAKTHKNVTKGLGEAWKKQRRVMEEVEKRRRWGKVGGRKARDGGSAL